MSARNSGMTLLELLVVVMILALLSGLFPLALQQMLPARRVAATARVLAVELRDLQSRSAVSGKPLELTLQDAGYRVQRSDVGNFKRMPLPRGIVLRLSADEPLQSARRLVMYPDGSSTGGRFEVREGRYIAIITVSPLTGHVHAAR